jgi:hypothetical protein
MDFNQEASVLPGGRKLMRLFSGLYLLALESRLSRTSSIREGLYWLKANLQAVPVLTPVSGDQEWAENGMPLPDKLRISVN